VKGYLGDRTTISSESFWSWAGQIICNNATIPPDYCSNSRSGLSKGAIVGIAVGVIVVVGVVVGVLVFFLFMRKRDE
jgi:hypothetical protein